MNEIFRAVAYKSMQEGRIIVQCLEIAGCMESGQDSEGLDKLFERMSRSVHARVLDSLDKGVSPYNPAEEKVWELIKPGMETYREIESHNSRISGIVAVMCYDRTDATISIETH